MVSAKRQRPEKMTLEDAEILDCGVCCHPLKPPIFQCKEGHALCSSCCDKLLPTGKCHVCRVSTHGGYQRCRVMERLVETARVVCPNAAHGCDMRMTYYNLASHRKECPHGPCHCPGEACSFVGTTKQLLDHITGSHRWPCIRRNTMPREMSICLQDGFNFLVVDNMIDDEGTTSSSTTGVFLFLLNLARLPTGRAISVFCIHPRHTCDDQEPSMAIQCMLRHSLLFRKSNLYTHHYLQSDINVEFTDLSDGLPNTEECFKFVVPNSALGDKEKESMNVDIRINIIASNSSR